MKFSYATRVTLTIENVSAEDLATVLDTVSGNVYPECIGIEPEYKCDYYGEPISRTGTYTVSLRDGVGGCHDLDAIIAYVKDSYERLKQSETDLTK